MNDWTWSADQVLNEYLLPLGWRLAGAVALWVVGSWVIRWIDRMGVRAMSARRVDSALMHPMSAVVRVLLRLVLALAVLGIFGVQTTTFAALLAAAGIAIGAAWSGLLAHFAAGVLLSVLKPFRAGDTICAAGVTGEVRELGLFATAIDTADNVRVVVGNNRILSDNVINYSVNPYRRVDLTAQLPHGVDPRNAIDLLIRRIRQVANVISTPAPQVDILGFNVSGTVLAVRPFCYNKDYWQVYFDSNHAIQEVFASAGYGVPATHQVIIHSTDRPIRSDPLFAANDSHTGRSA